jgi:hypothetical protein
MFLASWLPQRLNALRLHHPLQLRLELEPNLKMLGVQRYPEAADRVLLEQ